MLGTEPIPVSLNNPLSTRLRDLVIRLPHTDPLFLLIYIHPLVNQILDSIILLLLSLVVLVLGIANFLQLRVLNSPGIIENSVLQLLVEHVAFIAHVHHLVLVFNARALIYLASLTQQLLSIHLLNIPVVLGMQLLQLFLNVLGLSPQLLDILVEQNERVGDLVSQIGQIGQNDVALIRSERLDGEASGFLLFFVGLYLQELVDVELGPLFGWTDVHEVLFAVIAGAANYCGHFL